MLEKRDTLVLDLETKRAFEDVGGRDNLGELGVSLVGVYSYRNNEYQAYWEADFPKLLSLLMEGPFVIGFNHRRFDFPVLQPYFKDFDLQKLPMLDILEDLNRILGHRVKLDSVAQATLDIRKSGHGLDAIRYWNVGRLDDLKKYCLDDVRITKEIFDYGVMHGEVFFMDRSGLRKKNVSVDWKKFVKEKKEKPDEEKQFRLF